MILEWKKLALDLQKELKEKAMNAFGEKKGYVAIIFLWEDFSSATYVRHKKKYGESIGLPVVVFGQNQHVEYDRNQAWNFDDVGIYINQNYDNIFKLMELIKYLNHDNECVGIIVQLPLPEQFKQYKTQILSAITPEKDLDGMWGVVYGLNSIDLIDFTPATPKAVMYLLDKYNLWDMKGKIVSIIGQSNIVGKPLIFECIKRGATVASFNQSNSLEEIKMMTKESDYIISCTGKVHLVDETFVRDDKSQVIVDVGYGHKDGKAVGDIQIDAIKDKVASYTPVPGGVGPLTVASLFSNVFALQGYKAVLKPYKL